MEPIVRRLRYDRDVAQRWLVLGVLAACGRFNFDPLGTAGGGGGGGGGDGASGNGAPGLSGQQAYVKASNTGPGDQFGFAIALSADGSTMAVGAYGEASTAPGIGGDQTNNNAQYAGAVYVFTRSGTTMVARFGSANSFACRLRGWRDGRGMEEC